MRKSTKEDRRKLCDMGLAVKLNGNTGKTCQFLRKQLINCGVLLCVLALRSWKAGERRPAAFVCMLVK